MPNSYEDTIREDLRQGEGINGQNYTTGTSADIGSYISQYSNRLFGAPFQLLDSVDKRFPGVNPMLGNEYLRNFMLNSPILHIRPGMPKYTGDYNASSVSEIVRNIYSDVVAGGMNTGDAIFTNVGNTVVFGSGRKLQSRMFGFRETYYAYIQHVNYMCRSVATYMNLVNDAGLPDSLKKDYSGYEASLKPPNICYVSKDKSYDLGNMDWQLYRMTDVTDEYMSSAPNEELKAIATSYWERFLADGKKVIDAFGEIPEEWQEDIMMADKASLLTQVSSKLSSVEFMVEPIEFTETLTNTTGNSFIESAVDAIGESIGSELAWITNSNSDFSIIENLFNMLGDTADSAARSVGSLVQSVDSGFTKSLFSGAISALRGQKMIYPKIYKRSESHMDYQFSITLTTPYGDPYNYYMNIIVPLLHLIALAAPRMVTSNTVASPFLVQAYIPGMCTCQLGIINNMSIQKNPSTNHVSVNGFPLTVKVTFSIEELYNAMSISPANDPASFLHNETLNDYLCNMAGLVPSLETYAKQRATTYQEESRWFENGTWLEGVYSGALEFAEDLVTSGGSY